MRKLGESVESAAPPVRRRDVTWEDPLVSAALARDLSGLVFEPRPTEDKESSGRSGENGHGR